MQGRLLARHDVKGDTEENRRIGEEELARCAAMGIQANAVLRLDDMARNDNVIFSATGITKGDLLDGITRKGNMATTETLLIRGKSRTIRRINLFITSTAKIQTSRRTFCKPFDQTSFPAATGWKSPR